jgi:hypothetical protein
MAHRAQLRASDADREHVAERLRHATAEGRLHPDELEHRLGAALSAKTYGELDALVTDLPSPPVSRRARFAMPAWLPPVVALAIAIPVALVVLAVVVFVVTGLFVGWLFWLILGWWFFAGRRRAYAHGGHRARISPCGLRRSQTRPYH